MIKVTNKMEVEIKNVDFIIVGCGLAGIAFAETCLNQEKTVHIFDDASQNSSTIAAGIYNPVILKRFSGLESAQEQLDLMNEFYNKLSAKIDIQFDHKISVLRKFTSIEEQNNWFSASDKDSLAPFLSLEIHKKKYDSIDSPFDFGMVFQTGYVDSQLLLRQYKAFLQTIDSYQADCFEHEHLIPTGKFIKYKNIVAKHIVFAEGYGMHANPYFDKLPLDGTKGEIIVIKAPNLELDKIVNSSLYIVPLGNQLFKVGATYNWSDKTNCTSKEGLKELTDKLNEIITCSYEIIKHLAGIRPTVKDRKPLLGTHYAHNNIHILNGLGTRGVMLGPWCAKKLYDAIENNIVIEKSINVNRFYY